MTTRRRALARVLATQPPQRHAITATVTTINTTQKVITVSPHQGAQPDAYLNVPHLAHYTPAAGDTALLLWVGGNALIAIGKLA
jgi:hypothetical protein